jgi:hypothetical protein
MAQHFFPSTQLTQLTEYPGVGEPGPLQPGTAGRLQDRLLPRLAAPREQARRTSTASCQARFSRPRQPAHPASAQTRSAWAREPPVPSGWMTGWQPRKDLSSEHGVAFLVGNPSPSRGGFNAARAAHARFCRPDLGLFGETERRRASAHGCSLPNLDPIESRLAGQAQGR